MWVIPHWLKQMRETLNKTQKGNIAESDKMNNSKKDRQGEKNKEHRNREKNTQEKYRFHAQSMQKTPIKILNKQI